MQRNWNGLDLDLIWIEIGVFKNFKECARLPCNGNHFLVFLGGCWGGLVVTKTNWLRLLTDYSSYTWQLPPTMFLPCEHAQDIVPVEYPQLPTCVRGLSLAPSINLH